MSIELVMSSNHLIYCFVLLLLPSIFPNIRVFSNERALCTRWPKLWSFNFSISSFNVYPGFISFRIDWFHLLAVKVTLKSLLQHHISKTPILWHSAIFMVQLSHSHMTTGQTIALTIWNFVGKMISMHCLGVDTGLEMISFHSNPPKKEMPKNDQITTQLHSSHTLAK